jgi:hypothetical protein
MVFVLNQPQVAKKKWTVPLNSPDAGMAPVEKNWLIVLMKNVQLIYHSNVITAFV